MTTKKIVHIGLGAFLKAHQAWYTYKSDVAKNWEIIAFTGRGPAAAEELKANNFKYELITRGPESDITETIDSITNAFDISDISALNSHISDPATAIVTLTITESGYNREVNGPIVKLVNALKIRAELNGSPIAIIPCDNLMQNGALLLKLLWEITKSDSVEFRDYLSNKVKVVSTSVDRITPKSNIPNTVITEPYSSWILQGEFPLGRPSWEIAGAQIVTELAPFERRKLWLLNGAHSYLAYAGLQKGFETVSQAIQDRELFSNVEKFWDEASSNLSNSELNISKFRRDLIARFSNPRIEHKLSQIAIDGSLKLKERIVPVALEQINKKNDFSATAEIVANWILYIASNDFADANKSLLLPILNENHKLVEFLSTELIKSRDFIELIDSIVQEKKAVIC